MKGMRRQISKPFLKAIVAAACSLISCIGWDRVPAAAQTPTASPGGNPVKDPKLSSLLQQLRDSVSQRGAPVDPSMRATVAAKMRQKQPPKPVEDALHAKLLEISSEAKVRVYIEMDDLEPAKLQQLQELGVEIEVQADPQSKQSGVHVYSVIPTVQAEIPVETLRQVESLPFVRFIRMPDYAMSSSSGSVVTQGDHLLQADAVRKQLGVTGKGVSVGVISSGIGGIFASNCTTNCQASSVTPSPMALGDLPSSTGTRTGTVLTSVSGGITAVQSFRQDKDLEDTADGSDGAEGTAMLEIVYAMAPDASLSFTNAKTGLEFEAAVNAMAQTNQIVVDDKFFVAPSYDGMSAISQNTAAALNNPSNPILAYITSGGNLALDHYQGTFSPSAIDGAPYTNEPGFLHQFSGVVLSSSSQPAAVDPPYPTIDAQNLGAQPFDPLITLGPGQTVTVSLSWNDPVGGSTNNYDLFLVQLDCSSSVGALPAGPCTMVRGQQPIASSTNAQTGTQDPFQQLTYENPMTAGPVNLGIVIQNVGNNAAPVTFDMFITGQGAKENVPNHNYYSRTGSVPAQSDAGGSPASVISVGAINQVQCLSPDNCTGTVERFSSQGPTQVTPQNKVGMTKPNVVALDEVCITGAGGFGNTIPTNQMYPFIVTCPVTGSTSYTPKLFGGTSAAAPHVAAIAALMLQMAPCLAFTNASQSANAARETLYEALTGALPGMSAPTYSYAVPLSAYSALVPNDAEGYGLINALSSAVGLLPVANPSTPTLVSATSSTGAAIQVTLNSGSSTSSSTGSNLSGCPIVALQWSGITSNTSNGSTPTCASGQAHGISATVECPIGIDPLYVSASVNGISFLPTTEMKPIDVTVTDFAVSASPYSNSSTTTPVTVAPGAPGIFVVSVTSAGQGAFTNPVALSCSNLPAGVTCQFSPATVTMAASQNSLPPGQTSMLTVYTSGTAFSRGGDRLKASLVEVCLIFPWLTAPLLFLSMGRRKSLRKALLGLAVVCCVVSLSSCSSKSTSIEPTPNSYTITINGTSNQLIHTATITLNIGQ
jgi:hypothetical protein